MNSAKKVHILIQARMGSTRLPGKILKPFVGGYTVLEWIVARARFSGIAKKIIVATTTNSKDDATQRMCQKIGCEVWRGSEEDVLQRFVDAAEAFQSDVIAQINADEPYVDIAELDRLLRLLQTEKFDYVGNHAAGMPLGTGSEAYTASALFRLKAATDDPYDHEHVTSYFYHHPEFFQIKKLAPRRSHPFAPQARLTLDSKDDLRHLQAIARGMKFSDPTRQPSTNEILSFLASHPEVVAINAHVVQKPF